MATRSCERCFVLRCSLLFLLLFLCLAGLIPSAQSQELGVFQETSQVTSTTCTCDCCTTIERSPAEVTIGQDGASLHFKCVEGSLTVCASSCTALNAQEEVDYSRYCLEDCQPALASIGSTCLSTVDALTNVTLDRGGIPLSEGSSPGANAAAAASPAAGAIDAGAGAGAGESEAAPAGGGGSDAAAAATVGTATTAAPTAAASPWEAKVQQQQKSQLKKAEEAVIAGMDQRVLVEDNSKLVAQRLRAEASADLVRSATTEEGIQANSGVLQQDLETIQKVGEAVTDMPAGLQKSVSQVTSEAEVAETTLDSVKLALKAARGGALAALRGAKKEAEEAIRSAVAPLVAQEAEANLNFDEDATNRALATKAVKTEAHSETLLKEARILQDESAVAVLISQSERRGPAASKRARSLEREV